MNAPLGDVPNILPREDSTGDVPMIRSLVRDIVRAAALHTHTQSVDVCLHTVFLPTLSQLTFSGCASLHSVFDMFFERCRKE